MKRITLYLLAAAALIGCSSGEDVDYDTPGRSTTPITFSIEESTTRGMVPLETNTLHTMGIFAGYEKEEETFSSTSPANDFINNVRYTRSEITHPFAGEDVCYWPFSGKLSFFAYAPYVSSKYLQFSSDYVSGYPRMNYEPTTDVTNQPDLCFATPVLDQHKTTTAIPLSFNHSLSQVLFSANYSGDLPTTSASLYVKIDSIRICNVIGRKKVVMNNGTPCFDWQDDSECTAADRTSYLLRRGGLPEQCHIQDEELLEATSPATDNYRDMSTANGILYLLPQSMTDGEAYLRVTYGFYEMVGTMETLRASVTTRCNLPAATWLPMNSYRYKFTINLATHSIVNPTVQVGDWQSVNHTETNPIHIE